MQLKDNTLAADTELGALPLREELRGKSAYGAPQLEVPVALNTNENPYAPSQQLIDALVDEVARVSKGLNRYPERDAVALREDLAAYVSRQTGVHVTRDNVWVCAQLLHAPDPFCRHADGVHSDPAWGGFPD